jgi:hypothetical protein
VSKPAKRIIWIKQAKIGQTWYNLRIDTQDTGASYKSDWHPEKANRITIGVRDFKDYAEAYELLLHETVEIALEQRNGTAYTEHAPTNHVAYKRFAFTHEDFQYAMHEASLFLTAVAAEYYAAIHKVHPKLPRFVGEKPLIGNDK